MVFYLVIQVFSIKFEYFSEKSFSIPRIVFAHMSSLSSSVACLSSSVPAFSSSARAVAFAIASRLCVAFNQAKGVAPILSGNTLRKGENGVALQTAVEAAQS